MKTLVICRPLPGADQAAFSALVGEELAALRRLKVDGLLLEAYSPGRPGAVLVLEGEAGTVEDAVRGLPLAQAGLLSMEKFPLYPMDL